MGLSAGNSFPYVISRITGFSFGICVNVIYVIYIITQWLLLGKNFHKKNLLQIAVAFIYGRFVDIWVFLLKDMVYSSYSARFIQLAVSLLLVGLGVTLIVGADIVPNPIEGLTLAIAQKMKRPFFIAKLITDCGSVGLAIILSFIFLHTLIGVREGTVISAFLTAWFVRLFSVLLRPAIKVIFKYDIKKTL
jgi:uncharacterized membrane protein YczE